MQESHMADLVRVTEQDIGRATSVLAHAFQDDPLWTFATPDAVKREKMLPHLFRITALHIIKHGEIHATSPRYEGVAVWLPPGKSIAALDVFRVGLGDILAILWAVGPADFRRIIQILDTFESRQRQDAPRRFWYLIQIGVEPEYQGKGYGSLLISSMLERLDASHETCYLETETRENVAFYQKRGFRVVAQAPVKGGGPMLWTMIREPQEARA